MAHCDISHSVPLEQKTHLSKLLILSAAMSTAEVKKKVVGVKYHSGLVFNAKIT